VYNIACRKKSRHIGLEAVIYIRAGCPWINLHTNLAGKLVFRD
jgi:hypothetical protein